MNKFKLFIITLLCVTNLHAQKWNIGSPIAENVTATLSGGTLTITGTGDMVNFYGYSCPWSSYRDNIKSVVIGNGITNIGNDAFRECCELASVTIGTGVTSIGNNAFNSCSKLTTITIPNSVTTIDYRAFQYCSGLTAVSIGNKLTSIGSEAFGGCSALISVTIPNSVTNIESYAFSDCRGLSSVTVQWAVPLSISANVFYNCSTKFVQLNIPQGTAATYSNAPVWKDFYIEGVSMPLTGSCGANLTWAYDSNNGRLTISGTGEMETEFLWPWDECREKIRSVVLPAGLTSIGTGAFQSCSNLSGSLVIPNSVTSIGRGAFSGGGGYLIGGFNNEIGYISANKLTSVVVGNGVISIGNGAFVQCMNLTEVKLGSNVAYIGDRVFAHCTSLEVITIEATTPPKWEFEGYEGYPFGNLNCTYWLGSIVCGMTPSYNHVVKVPAASLSAYRGDENWSKFGANLIAIGSEPVITITAQPSASTSVTAGNISGNLSVSASVTQGATLTYQWYSNTTTSNTDGTAISGATNANFVVPTTLTAGTYYYYCVVRASGAAPAHTNVAMVTVAAPTPLISITAQPAVNSTVTEGSISGSLSVSASVTQGAALTFQWYSNTTASNAGGSAIQSATTASFAIPATLTAGTYYYYCVVSAAGAISVPTNAATVTVNPPASIIGVTVSPNPATVQQGAQQQFAATITATGGAPETVTWSIAGHALTATQISASGLLTIASGETATTLTVTATSTFDTGKKGTATVTVAEPPAVTNVAVAPNTATVVKGAQQQFTANVTATGGAPQTVEWSIAGHALTATQISETGLLTVAAGETAATLTVTATSTHDASQKGTATVTITETPMVTGVTLSPLTATIQQGGQQQFIATVATTGGAPTTVTWNITGNVLIETNITTSGLLTVAAGETAEMFTVRATSIHDVDKYGEATVTITTAGNSTISGTVVGVPAGTEVQLWSAPEGTAKSGVPGGFAYVTSTTTNGTGYYNFNQLPPGVYIVIVIMDGYQSHPTNPITLGKGETAGNVNFTLKGDTITPDGLTGSEELFAPNLKVYPNPFTGTVHITGADGCTMRVINSAGKIVLTQKIINSDEPIRLEHLPVGVYFFVLEKDGQTKTVKVIKN